MASDREVQIFLERHIGWISKTAGGLIGTSAALATGAPLIAVALSPYMSSQIERGLSDFVKRQLAPRQEARVAGTILISAIKIRQRLELDEKPRSNDFFERDGTGLSDADEVLEAALIAAMNAAQEKKVEFIATLISNVNFNDKISPSFAHQLIELAQSLSYRSYILLKIFGEVDKAHFEQRPGKDVPEPSADLEPVMIEAFSLVTRALLYKRTLGSPTGHYQALLGAGEIDPKLMILGPTGRVLYETLGLESLSNLDPVYISTMDELTLISNAGAAPSPEISANIDGGGF